MNLPLTVVIVLVAVAISVGAFLLIRRFSPGGGFFNDGDRAAGVFGVLATGFSVLLGFVVFLAFTTYDTARSGAQSEASDVIQQYETAQLMPQAGIGAALGRADLLRAGRRRTTSGRSSSRAAGRCEPWGIALFQTLHEGRPEDRGRSRLPTRSGSIRPRIASRPGSTASRPGNGVIPGPLWLILFVTGALVALYAFLFADPDEHWLPQAVIAGTIAAMLAISLLVIQFLNNPYSPGTGSLKPTEMMMCSGR